MSLQTRLISLIIFLVLLLLAGIIATGSFNFILVDFWFNAGIIMILFGALIDQPFFSKDTDILLNGIGGAISLLSISSPDRKFSWWLFFIISVYLVGSSYLIMYLRAKWVDKRVDTLNIISKFNRFIGNPRTYFSMLFFWGIYRKFTIDSKASNILFLYWAIFISFDALGLGKYISKLIKREKSEIQQNCIGFIRGLIEPNVVLVNINPEIVIHPGSNVTIGPSINETLAKGLLMDVRALSGQKVGKILINSISDRLEKNIAKPDCSTFVYLSEEAASNEIESNFIGVVESNSEVSTLRTIARYDLNLQQGQLLTSKFFEKNAYYQITSGKIQDIKVDSENSYRSFMVEAQQLGIWNDEKGRFEPIPWVASPNHPVLLVNESTTNYKLEADRFIVGNVPNSAFPVHVSIQDIITHNSAILGVTGSGKSYLAFSLIESMINQGIKVLVLDISRQHWVYLKKNNPTPLKSETEVSAWLDDNQSQLGIYQFANENRSLPAATLKFVEQAFSKLSNVKLTAGMDIPAKLCIVLEEAHSLIPEWNVASSPQDSSFVNNTARIILQGRKYGMGVLIVTQRTANVTKTILNQCNTIFALQSFDQTGLDFLRNYMGESYAQAISTLPARHCILVGKASSSIRPIIFKVKEIDKSHWENERDNESKISEKLKE